MGDLDTIAQALAAGRAAAEQCKTVERMGEGYRFAQARLITIYAGIAALERISAQPQPEPAAPPAAPAHDMKW